MAQANRSRDGDAVLGDFRQALDEWRLALQAHRLAPPDHGFTARLAGLARAAREQARACREADAAGYDWTPTRAAESKPPHELRPDSGRRGPKELWQRFDGAVAHLSRVATGRDIIEVALAYEELGEVAEALAKAVQAEDRASGLLPSAGKKARAGRTH